MPIDETVTPLSALLLAYCSASARLPSSPSLASTTRRTRPLPAAASAAMPCASAGGMLVPPPAWMASMRATSRSRTCPTRASGCTSSVSLAYRTKAISSSSRMSRTSRTQLRLASSIFSPPIEPEVSSTTAIASGALVTGRSP